MNDLNNVYQSTQVDYEDDGGEEMELATPGKRIAAYLINYLISLVAAVPLIIGFYQMYKSYVISAQAGASAPDFSGASMGMIGLGSLLVLAYYIVQAVLMSKNGQSMGKRIMKIKVVDEDGDNPGFVKVVLMREVVPNLVLAFVGMIPFLGPIAQIGFWVACLVMLFLVDRDRQTLQDMIAKTYVVDAE
ncbi:RDD family protein [Vitreoscilla massiliensis]|uniref:RDD family protein n=1 Tax=Vitreoscilla massiliensis TaxID=1689272 RepID=A0ABY4E4B9_9NEIS|nr:RDD family protein [Vitreoscilla massiliensis]UOO90347.1 RDD family protein [Vitreoscilla massiliensis]